MQATQRTGVVHTNQAIAMLPEQQAQLIEENEKLKKQIEQIAQMYQQTIGENKQLQELVNRGSKMGEKETQGFEATIKARDEQIAFLKGEKEALRHQLEDVKGKLKRESQNSEKLAKKAEGLANEVKSQRKLLDMFESAIDKLEPYIRKHITGGEVHQWYAKSDPYLLNFAGFKLFDDVLPCVEMRKKQREQSLRRK